MATFKWKAEPRSKTPYYINPTSQEFFAFAGLYDVWTKPDGEELYTFTIITKDSDGVVAQLHNRVPVILERERGLGHSRKRRQYCTQRLPCLADGQ